MNMQSWHVRQVQRVCSHHPAGKLTCQENLPGPAYFTYTEAQHFTIQWAGSVIILLVCC